MRYDLDHSLGPMYVGPIRDRQGLGPIENLILQDLWTFVQEVQKHVGSIPRPQQCRQAYETGLCPTTIAQALGPRGPSTRTYSAFAILVMHMLHDVGPYQEWVQATSSRSQQGTSPQHCQHAADHEKQSGKVLERNVGLYYQYVLLQVLLQVLLYRIIHDQRMDDVMMVGPIPGPDSYQEYVCRVCRSLGPMYHNNNPPNKRTDG